MYDYNRNSKEKQVKATVPTKRPLFLLSCICIDSVDYSSPVSSVHVILQLRIPEWVAIPFSRESS